MISWTVNIRDVQVAFRSVEEKVRKKVAKAAVTAALKPVLATARQLVPVETRTLKRALGRKVKQYKGVVYGVVGPRKGMGRTVTIKYKDKEGKTKTKEQYRNPTNYTHLVEWGTKHSAAKPFLVPALTQNEATVLEIFKAKIREAVKKK